MISRAFCATKIENRVDNKFASSERHNLSEKCGPNLLGVRGMGIGDRGRALCGRTAPIYIGSGVSAINIQFIWLSLSLSAKRRLSHCVAREVRFLLASLAPPSGLTVIPGGKRD